MAKITAKEVTEGMVFELVSQEHTDYGPKTEINFGYKIYGPNDQWNAFEWARGIHVPIGSKLTVTSKVYKDCGQKVKFKLEDGREMCTFWTYFRNNTKLISGTAAKVTKPAITSNGPYAGMDIMLEKFEHNNYCSGLGYGEFKFVIKFIGTLEGVKQMNTKLINKVKRAPGFDDKMQELIFDKLKEQDALLYFYIRNINPQQVERSRREHRRQMTGTWYRGGRIEFSLSIMNNNVDLLKAEVVKGIQKFIESNSTSS